MTDNAIPQNTPNETPNTGIPLKWGLLTGFISILMTTIGFTFILGSSSYMLFIAFNIISFLVTVILFGIAGAQQRKALGGYISIRQAFSAIFKVILITLVMTTVYGLLYAKTIDPQVNDKIKEGTVAFMESRGIPDEVIDERVAAFETTIENSTKPLTLIFSFASNLIWYSIVGFICALIVRRKKPVFPQ